MIPESPTEATPRSSALLARVDAPRRASAWKRYGFTLAAVALATLATSFAAEALSRTIFILFWPAVIGAALFAGLGPAMLASVLSVVLADYMMIPPTGSFEPGTKNDILPLVLFLAISALVNALAELARRQQHAVLEGARLRGEYAAQLEQKGIELARQLEESQAVSEELELTAEELEERSEAAENAERFSRSIVESISDPFIVLDNEFRFVYVNYGAARAYARGGHSEMVGKVIWEEYPDLVGSEFYHTLSRTSEARESASLEILYEKTGTWSTIHCYPLTDNGMAIQWQDITERKRAEESAHYLQLATAALSSSLDYEATLTQLAALVVPQLGDWCSVQLVENGETKQVAVAHIDPAKVEFARQLEARYPPPKDAPYGAPNVLRTGVPEVFSDVTDEMLRAGARDEEHLAITRSLKIRSGIIAPLTANGRVTGVLTLVAAESGRRYTDADLPLVMELARRAAMAVENARHHRAALDARASAEALQREAEAANVAKTQFLTSMSHELRTPLNAIAGYADLMSLGIHGPTTETQLEDLERIKRNQRHLLGIINDILNYARLDAGRVQFDIANIAVQEVIDDLQPMIQPQIAERQITFDCPGVARRIEVRADRERLRQVLINLLSNAIKFTEPGGRISLDCHADAHVVELSVRDTGVGIPTEKLQSIFEPFIQLNRTLAKPVEGTGLGLAISREMVEGMHGTLTATSEVGKGSVFTVAMPRSAS